MRLVKIALVSATILGISAGTAHADGAAHNCAGAGSSFLAQALPPGEFGAIVSFFAGLQAVDNFGLANCGNTNRNNP